MVFEMFEDHFLGFHHHLGILYSIISARAFESFGPCVWFSHIFWETAIYFNEITWQIHQFSINIQVIQAVTFSSPNRWRSPTTPCEFTIPKRSRIESPGRLGHLWICDSSMRRAKVTPNILSHIPYMDPKGHDDCFNFLFNDFFFGNFMTVLGTFFVSDEIAQLNVVVGVSPAVCLLFSWSLYRLLHK